MYFNVNFNVFFKLIKVHLLVSELYIYQNARCNDKNCLYPLYYKLINLRVDTSCMNSDINTSYFCNVFYFRKF